MNLSDPVILGLMAVAIVAGVVIFMRVLSNAQASLWLVGGMLLASALATQGDILYSNFTWLRPIQLLRAEIYLGLGVVLMFAVVAHAGKMSMASIPGLTIVMMIINTYAGMGDMAHGSSPMDGLQRIIFSGITLSAMALMLPAIVRTWDDCLKLVRMVGMVGVIWCAAVGVQVVIDRQQLILREISRFTGMLGNPQSTAVFLGPVTSVLTWLAFNDNHRRFRPVWIAGTIASIVCLGWTGSRTGAVMYIMGLMAILYTRVGRAVFLLPVAAGGVYGLIMLAESLGIKLGLDRLLSKENTRADVWSMLLDDAIHAGPFGQGGVGAQAVENSYLLGTAVYGWLMGLLMFVLIVAGAVTIIKLVRVRPFVPPMAKRLIDLTVAYYAMYFIGAVFEWYIVARLDANIVFMIVFTVLATRITAMAREARAEPDSYYGYSDYSDTASAA